MQTLYLAWGSNRALLRAYMDAALAAETPVPGSLRPGLTRAAATDTA